MPAACKPPALAIPTDAAVYECMAVRNCDLEVDVAALDGLLRQAALLVRTVKRRPVRSIAMPAASPIAPWHRGRLPNGDVEPLNGDYNGG